MATRKKTGGRKRGTPNKDNKALKEMILGALDAKGGEKWLVDQMDKNPSAFLSLLGRILPMQTEVTGKDGGPVEMKTQFELVPFVSNDNENDTGEA